MPQISAGVLVFRWQGGELEFLLAHPGGPYWADKDAAAWSIPKGVVEAGEANWAAARREFAEEIGQPIAGPAIDLKPHRTPGGKVIHCWIVEADLDLTVLRSNLFELEWPPRSGRIQRFPEVDRAAYFDWRTALGKIHKGQRAILEEAVARLCGGLPPEIG